MMMRAASTRSSTGWPNVRCAAAMTEAGIRTAAPFPHFLTMTRMMAPDCCDVARTGRVAASVNIADTGAAPHAARAPLPRFRPRPAGATLTP